MTKDAYFSAEEAEEYLNSERPDPKDIPKPLLQYAEEMIDKHMSFIDDEGWPVHIADTAVPPKSNSPYWDKPRKKSLSK